MGAMAKDLSPVEVQVPPEFVAQFVTEQMQIPLAKRPVLKLALGETDLGDWQVVGVDTRRSPAGYDVAIAKLRAVWP